jgi:hypothetical protein
VRRRWRRPLRWREGPRASATEAHGAVEGEGGSGPAQLARWTELVVTLALHWRETSKQTLQGLGLKTRQQAFSQVGLASSLSFALLLREAFLLSGRSG